MYSYSQLTDIQIGGDPLFAPHLLPAPAPGPATVAEFAALAREIAEDRDSWAPLVRYDAASRWYHRVRTGPGYEAWLLSWLPGQGSGRHGHGPSSGVFCVLEGELTELTGPAGAERRLRTPGARHVFAPGYVHEVVNERLTPAVSLHVYFPGLTRMPMHARRCAAA
ncbi:cysteine dioxygenase, partial [Streptomyces polyrhachis]